MLATKQPRYRLDKHGDSIENKVVNEPRHIGTEKKIRAIVPRCGAFFTKSLHVFDAFTHQELKEGVDYKCLFVDSDLIAKIGQPIAYVIAITNPTVSSDIYYSMQAVGGMGVYMLPLLNTIIPLLNSEDRIQYWTNIADKPDKFNPGYHYHDAGDFYGFEFLVLALLRISSILTDRDLDDHTEIMASLNLVDAEFRRRWAEFEDDFDNHVLNYNNPHEVTADLLDVFTRNTIANLLNGKLGSTERAVNSIKLFGFTLPELKEEIQKNYNGSVFGNGVFPHQRLGISTSGNTEGLLLTNKNTFEHVSGLVGAADPIFIGESTASAVATTFADAPRNTIINFSSGGLYYHLKKIDDFNNWQYV